MIIVSQCVKKVKENIIEIYSRKKVICPVCKGDVVPHGKCIRKLVTENTKRKLSLRVWYCPECKHSHREIPRCIIPYKRYSAKIYAKIYDSELDDIDFGVDESTVRRIKAWVKWFLEFAASFMEGMKIEHPELPTNYEVGSTLSALRYFVRLVVNANEWKFSVPPLLS